MMSRANTTVEWQLEQLPAGADVVIKDDKGRLIARGTVNADRVSLRGPTGENIPIISGQGWRVIVLAKLGTERRSGAAAAVGARRPRK
jgi:hypothetical protein